MAKKPPAADKPAPKKMRGDPQKKAQKAMGEEVKKLAAPKRMERPWPPTKDMPFRKRPKITDPGIVDKLCERIVSGDVIPKICESEEFPSSTDVYMCLAHGGPLAAQIQRAREYQQEAMVDQMITLADSSDEVNYNAQRVKIWARQWYAAKLNSGKFGEKAKLVTDDATPPVIRIVGGLPDEPKK